MDLDKPYEYCFLRNCYTKADNDNSPKVVGLLAFTGIVGYYQGWGDKIGVGIGHV